MALAWQMRSGIGLRGVTYLEIQFSNVNTKKSSFHTTGFKYKPIRPANDSCFQSLSRLGYKCSHAMIDSGEKLSEPRLLGRNPSHPAINQSKKTVQYSAIDDK